MPIPSSAIRATAVNSGAASSLGHHLHHGHGRRSLFIIRRCGEIEERQCSNHQFQTNWICFLQPLNHPGGTIWHSQSSYLGSNWLRPSSRSSLCCLFSCTIQIYHCSLCKLGKVCVWNSRKDTRAGKKAIVLLKSNMTLAGCPVFFVFVCLIWKEIEFALQSSDNERAGLWGSDFKTAAIKHTLKYRLDTRDEKQGRMLKIVKGNFSINSKIRLAFPMSHSQNGSFDNICPV